MGRRRADELPQPEHPPPDEGGEQGDALAYFADELPWELDVDHRGAAGGTVLRLIFPEYREIYEENCPAHHFDYNISGAGYPYHHSFRNKRLDLRTYDELWPGFLGMEHETESAVRLAFWRLRYPAELSPRAEERYLTYLRAHAGRGGSLAGGGAGRVPPGLPSASGAAGGSGALRGL